MFCFLYILFKECLELSELTDDLSLDFRALFFCAVDDSGSLVDKALAVFFKEFFLSCLSGKSVVQVNIVESDCDFSLEFFDDSFAFGFPEFAVLFLKLEVGRVVVGVRANCEDDGLSDEESHDDRGPPACD